MLIITTTTVLKATVNGLKFRGSKKGVMKKRSCIIKSFVGLHVELQTCLSIRINTLRGELLATLSLGSRKILEIEGGAKIKSMAL